MDAETSDKGFLPLSLGAAPVDGTSLAVNIPVFLTPFVGRLEERLSLGEAIRSERLVSVVGTGGVGKTRLTREVGVELSRTGLETYWVELVEIVPSGIDTAIRSAFGISAASKFGLGETIGRLLADRPAVLILDNVEHLVESIAPLVGELLVSCPSLRILTTTRVTMGLPGEVEWVMPPMSLPGSDPSPASGPAGEPEQGDAVALFLERARRSGTKSSSSEAERIAAGTVELICRRLGGIPLAIELAAARCRVLTPAQILKGLDNSLSLLSGGSPFVPERQQDLEGSIRWSYDLLDTEGQRLLRGVSVFRGGWTMRMLRRVFPEESVLGTIDDLVQHSLVYVESEAVGPDQIPELRFSMLETVRQFAAARLAEGSEEEQVVFTRYAELYSEWALGFRLILFADGQEAWLPVLRAERANILHAATLHALAGRPHPICDIMRGVQGYALLADWVGPIEALASLADRFDDELSLDERALKQWMRTMLSFCEGDIGAVIAGCELLANGEEYRNHPEFSRRGQAVMLLMFGAAGMDIIDEMLELARSEPESDHPYWGRFTYVGVEGIAIHQGQLAKARSVGPVLDQRMEQAGSMPLARMRDLYRGRLAFAEGDLEEALRLLTRAAFSSSTALASRLMAIGYAGLVFAELDPEVAARSPYRLDWGHLHELIRHSVEVEGSLMAEGYAEWLRVGEAIFDGNIDDALGPLQTVVRTTTELGAAPLSFHEQYTLCAAGIARPDSPGWLWTGSTYAEAAYERSLAELALGDDKLEAAMDHVADALKIELPQEADRGPCFSLETAARILIAQQKCVEGLRIMGACDAFRRSRSHRRAPCLADLRDEALLSARACLSPSEYQTSLTEGAALSITEAADLLLRPRSRRGRPATGWEALTPTEARVGEHVASGMTNREVGRELLMSPETVKTHLSRVFAKVGVVNRKELIVETHRRRRD